jgi:hypothetical protein
MSRNIILGTIVVLASIFMIVQADEKAPLKPITTECNFRKSSKMFSCNSTAGADECPAKLQGIAGDFTTFAIGELKSTGGSNPVAWFRIHPRKDDNSGWWFYKNVKNQDNRLSIHSSDKNKSRDEGIIVTDPICWAKLSAIMRTSKTVETIKVEKFTKGLLTKPVEKVKTIGMLFIRA